MQLMPRTAAALGVSDPLDPEQNLDAGVRHLEALLKQYDGDLRASTRGLQRGPGGRRAVLGRPALPRDARVREARARALPREAKRRERTSRRGGLRARRAPRHRRGDADPDGRGRPLLEVPDEERRRGGAALPRRRDRRRDRALPAPERQRAAGVARGAGEAEVPAQGVQGPADEGRQVALPATGRRARARHARRAARARHGGRRRHHHDHDDAAVGFLAAEPGPRQRRVPGRCHHQHRQEPARLQRPHEVQRVAVRGGSAARDRSRSGGGAASGSVQPGATRPGTPTYPR